MSWISKCISCKKEVGRLRKGRCWHMLCAKCLEEGCLVCGEVVDAGHGVPEGEEE